MTREKLNHLTVQEFEMCLIIGSNGKRRFPNDSLRYQASGEHTRHSDGDCCRSRCFQVASRLRYISGRDVVDLADNREPPRIRLTA
jgi:hypothetical protein